MTDKIQKALDRFSAKEKEWVKELLWYIKNKEIKNLDYKKLKGREDIYRVKKGKIRIIYRLYKNEIYILAIEKRSEKTYKNI